MRVWDLGLGTGLGAIHNIVHQVELEMLHIGNTLYRKYIILEKFTVENVHQKCMWGTALLGFS